MCFEVFRIYWTTSSSLVFASENRFSNGGTRSSPELTLALQSLSLRMRVTTFSWSFFCPSFKEIAYEFYELVLPRRSLWVGCFKKWITALPWSWLVLSLWVSNQQYRLEFLFLTSHNSLSIKFSKLGWLPWPNLSEKVESCILVNSTSLY